MQPSSMVNSYSGDDPQPPGGGGGAAGAGGRPGPDFDRRRGTVIASGLDPLAPVARLEADAELDLAVLPGVEVREVEEVSPEGQG